MSASHWSGDLRLFYYMGCMLFIQAIDVKGKTCSTFVVILEVHFTVLLHQFGDLIDLGG